MDVTNVRRVPVLMKMSRTTLKIALGNNIRWYIVRVVFQNRMQRCSRLNKNFGHRLKRHCFLFMGSSNEMTTRRRIKREDGVEPAKNHTIHNILMNLL